MDTSPAAILHHVLALVGQLSGRRLSAGADKLIGGDHGINGADGIILLERLEKEYGIDLAPFAESRATKEKGWFRTRTVWGDGTPRELAEEISRLV